MIKLSVFTGVLVLCAGRFLIDWSTETVSHFVFPDLMLNELRAIFGKLIFFDWPSFGNKNRLEKRSTASIILKKDVKIIWKNGIDAKIMTFIAICMHMQRSQNSHRFEELYVFWLSANTVSFTFKTLLTVL